LVQQKGRIQVVAQYFMSNFLKDVGQPIVYKTINPLINWLARNGVTPNTVTMWGFLLNIAAAGIFVYGALYHPTELRFVGWGGAMILLAGLFDMIDGRLARVSGQESKFGALFDSVLDRYSELVMFLGICFYLIQCGYKFNFLVAFVAMIGSIMVSYVRARAEGLGVECKDGLMQRPERILTIGITAVLCGIYSVHGTPFSYQPDGMATPLFENISIFTVPLFLMAILTNWTAYQRIQDSKKALSKVSSS
jgi:CDP-diacylglycerol---glycerol-3-phosphate 3-phosphatidyltransferase